jgi:AraC-like DNA-binding protein
MERMSMSALRAPSRERRELNEVRSLVASRAPAEGYTSHHSVCVYRFAGAATLVKSPTFGVTLGVVLHGKKIIRIGKHRWEVDRDRAVVITRDVEIESITSQESAEVPYLGVSISFSPEMVARALLTLAEAGGEHPSESVPAFVTEAEPAVLDALGRLIVASDDPLERRVLVPLVKEEILFRLLRSDAAAAVRAAVGREPDSVRILESMQYIRERSERSFSVAELARRVGMSPSHFAHRFRAVARISPMRYVREVRLERARSMLTSPGARAGEVAGRVGFASESHFTREFKRRFGEPPSHFQRRLVTA